MSGAKRCWSNQLCRHLRQHQGQEAAAGCEGQGTGKEGRRREVALSGEDVLGERLLCTVRDSSGLAGLGWASYNDWTAMILSTRALLMTALRECHSLPLSE